MKNQKITKIIITLATMFVVLLAAVTTSTASAETVKDCKQWHSVQSGDYLTLIAKSYGVDWRVIADINNISSPYVIYTGQKLCISTTTTTNLPITTPVTASGVKIYAAKVSEDKTVTLQGKYLVPSSRYYIYLSNYKVPYATQLVIGSVLTDKDGSFNATYNIPKGLIDISKIRVTIYNTKGDSTYNWFFNATLDGNTGGIGTPELSAVIESVKADKWVTVKVSNLPAKVTFNVYLGRAGSMGVNGIFVGTVATSKGGNATATFDIPLELQGKSKLDLRVEHQPFDMATYLTFENKTK
jgi:LysM repeat protein